MEITFRKAVIEDATVIADLAGKIWRNYYTAIITIEQIEYMLDKMYSAKSLVAQMEAGHQFTIALLGIKPVGYISISEKENGHYFLHKFYVDVDQHRQGIGHKLWDHVELELIKPCRVELTVNQKNFKAINFYFKKGFVIDHVADFDIGNGYFMNDFVMVKPIVD